MKTRKYFETKCEKLRDELITEITNNFHNKMKIGHCFYNTDDANAISFINEKTGIDEECIIDHIYNGNVITIYPDSKKHCSVQLNEMMNINELMAIHYISLNEID